MARARDDEALVLLGLGVLAMLVKNRDGVAWGEGWHMPVPDLELVQGGSVSRFPARATSGFRTTNRPQHNGLDIMYTRQPGEAPAFPPGVVDAEGGKQQAKYFAPIGIPILAARDGTVWSVGPTERGIMIVLDHGVPWATMYIHLVSTHLQRHAKGKNLVTGGVTRVKAGDLIGIMGFDPLDGQKLRHLHFEAWWRGAGPSAAQDPAPQLPSWGRSTWRIET